MKKEQIVKAIKKIIEDKKEKYKLKNEVCNEFIVSSERINTEYEDEEEFLKKFKSAVNEIELKGYEKYIGREDVTFYKCTKEFQSLAKYLTEKLKIKQFKADDVWTENINGKRSSVYGRYGKKFLCARPELCKTILERIKEKRKSSWSAKLDFRRQNYDVDPYLVRNELEWSGEESREALLLFNTNSGKEAYKLLIRCDGDATQKIDTNKKSNHGTTTTKPKSEPKPKPTPTPTPKPTKKTSKTAAGLCVTLKNGTTIQNEKAVDTFIEAIKKAGVEKVKDTGIKFCGVKIVDNKLDSKYGKTQRPCGNGLYILTHSSTADKKKILEKISDALKLGWNVEI